MWKGLVLCFMLKIIVMVMRNAFSHSIKENKKPQIFDPVYKDGIDF